MSKRVVGFYRRNGKIRPITRKTYRKNVPDYPIRSITESNKTKEFTTFEKARLAKELLERNFPNNIFRIRTGPHGTMVIYTDLIKDIPNDLQNANWRVLAQRSWADEDIDKSNLYQKMMEQNREIRDKIMDILRKAGIREKYQTDQVTGEILQGGNFFINTRPLEDYRRISERR